MFVYKSILSGFGKLRRRVGSGLYDEKPAEDHTKDSNENDLEDQETVDVNRRHADGQTPLTFAIRSKDVDSVQALLRHPGISLSYPEERQNSPSSTVTEPPLMVAVRSGRPDLVRMLLEAGARPDQATSEGETPLSACCETGNQEMARNLLSRDCPLSSGEFWYDPLHQACRHGHMDCVRLLVQAGCKVDPVKATHLLSPLQLALENQHEDICLYLLEHGADPQHKGNTMLSPFIRACWFGCAKVVKYLIKHGGDVNALAPDGNSALMYSLRSGDLSRISRELRVCDEGKKALLTKELHKIFSESISVINILCESGCDMEYLSGNLLLSPLCYALKAYNIPAAIALLKHGARWSDMCDVICEKLNIKRMQKIDRALYETLLNMLDHKHDVMYRRHTGVRSIPTLQSCARRCVRKSVTISRASMTSIKPQLRRLDIPKGLKDYLCYNEVDETSVSNSVEVDVMRFAML